MFMLEASEFSQDRIGIDRQCKPPPSVSKMESRLRLRRDDGAAFYILNQCAQPLRNRLLPNAAPCHPVAQRLACGRQLFQSPRKPREDFLRIKGCYVCSSHRGEILLCLHEVLIATEN